VHQCNSYNKFTQSAQRNTKHIIIKQSIHFWTTVREPWWTFGTFYAVIGTEFLLQINRVSVWLSTILNCAIYKSFFEILHDETIVLLLECHMISKRHCNEAHISSLHYWLLVLAPCLWHSITFSSWRLFVDTCKHNTHVNNCNTNSNNNKNILYYNRRT